MKTAVFLLALACARMGQRETAADEAFRQLQALSDLPAKQQAERQAAEARKRELEAQFWTEIHALSLRLAQMDAKHSVDAQFWPSLKEHAATIKRIRQLQDAR